MDRIKTGLKTSWKVITNPGFVLLGFVFGLTSLVISMEANSRSAEASRSVAEEANQRAAVVEQLYERQRLTFCGFFEPIAEAGKTQKPASSIGESVVKGSSTAVGPEGLTCTPDPMDGR